jgi:ketosteroid isomerase-like protein
MDQQALSEDLVLLLEERAITRALHEYAHAMDYGDEEAWVDAFTADAVFDVVEVVGGRRVHREEGSGDLARYVARYPKPPAFRKHVVVDPIIDVSGDTARVEAYWLLLQRDDDDGQPVMTAFGKYHDRLVKTDGRWRIAERYADVEATAAPAPAAEGAR